MDTTLNTFKRILNDGRSKIPAFLVLGVIGLFMVPLDFYGLLLSRKLVDEGFMTRDWATTRHLLIVLFVLFVIRSTVRYGTAVFSTKMQLFINKDFQNRIFTHIIHLPVSFFGKESTGSLMSRILDDAERFSSMFNLLFGTSLVNALRFMGLLVFLIYINVQICLLMLISILFSFVVIHWVGGKIRTISKDIQRENTAIYSFVEQVFPNIELIKSKIAENTTVYNFIHLMDNLIQSSIKALKISLISSPILQLLKFFALGVVFASGSWLITKGLLTIGELTSFLGAAYLLFNSINSLGNGYGTLRENLARMEIIYGIMDNPLERSLMHSGNRAVPSISTVEFKKISFSYKPPQRVLEDVSFKVSRGETLGITGQSGSGKTTITRLLLRFYEQDSGDIILNGHALSSFDPESLRSSIGIAFQDNLILNRSIKDNIAFGEMKTPMDKIIHAAEIAHAHDFIKSLPDRYDTIVGETGKGLSGGERQRLAIARAIVNDPEILILDEGTSFLEIEQEEAILKKSLKSGPGR